MCTTGAHAVRNNDNCKKSYSSCLLGVTMQHLELDPEATAIWFQHCEVESKGRATAFSSPIKNTFQLLFFSLYNKQVYWVKRLFMCFLFCVRRNLTSGWSQLNTSHFPSFFVFSVEENEIWPAYKPVWLWSRVCISTVKIDNPLRPDGFFIMTQSNIMATLHSFFE